jgi:hypothetical protein
MVPSKPRTSPRSALICTTAFEQLQSNARQRKKAVFGMVVIILVAPRGVKRQGERLFGRKNFREELKEY